MAYAGQPAASTAPRSGCCRAVSLANAAAANLRGAEGLAGQVEALGQRMEALQAALEDISSRVEQLSLSRAAPQ